jgi:predicted nucleotidyltransferase
MHEQISTIVREFDDPKRFAGALLVGSEARGDASCHSDVDIVFYAFDEPSDQHDEYRLTYREGRLISLSIKTLSAARAAFSNPVEAIRTVQGIRDSIVLRDSSRKDLSQLKEAAQEFVWTQELQAAANREASYQLMGNAEEVHKVLRGLSERNDLILLNGAWGLATAMPLVMALKLNILSAGDNLFRSQVCQAVGVDSSWAAFHAVSIGTRAGPSGYSHLAQQAIGGFWLYEETVRLARDVLTPTDAAVIERAQRTARESKLIPPVGEA